MAQLAGGGQLLLAAAWRVAGAPDLAAAAAAIRIACYGGPHHSGIRDAGSAEADRDEEREAATFGGSQQEGGSRQEQADVALAHAQLAMLAYERRGPECALFIRTIETLWLANAAHAA